jgi:hypothetical protein
MYTTVGNWTSKGLDCCDHEHETRDEAQRCLLEHQKAMRLVNKVSTRQIIAIESLAELDDSRPV